MDEHQMENITSRQVNKYSLEEQLSFYKDSFEYLHCKLEGCGNELGNDWVLSEDGDLYCTDCYEWLSNSRKVAALKEIKDMENKISILKEEHGIK